MKKQFVLMAVAVGVLALIGALVFWSGSQSGSAPIESGTAVAPTNVTEESSDSGPHSDVRANAEGRAASVVGDTAAAPQAASPSATAIPEGQGLEVLAVTKKDGKPVANAEIIYADREEESEDSFWSWLREGELEARIEPIASRYTTDSEGKSRVPKPVESAIVIARSGELWGYSLLGKKSESPIKLELVPDADLWALVVDPNGKPVAGARVALRTRGGTWFQDRITAATRASDGLAVLRHAGYTMNAEQHNGNWTWHVGLGAVLEKPVETPIEAGKLPPEPIRLVMPATGECEVRVLDTGGRPFDGELEVTLRVLDRDETVDNFGEHDWGRGLAMPEVRDGIALFSHVEPGRAFEATAQRHGSNNQHRARGLGPAAVGQRAVITLRVGERAPVIAGRALDASGAVLSERELRSRIEREGSQGFIEHNAWDMKSDSEGRFAVDVGEGADGAARTLTVYTVNDDGEERASATKSLPAQLGPGRHDLGDFLLQPSPLLVSGVVVDEQGQPVARATVMPATKQVWDESQPDAFWWQELWTNRGTSDDEGKFEIRGRVQTPEIGVWAVMKELKGQAAIVAPGASNVVLRLAATGEIAGVVLLDPSVPREALGIQVERADAENDPSDRWFAPVQPDEEGNFAVKGLKPASYTVRLQNTMGWQSLEEIADIAVTGGAITRDPRLDPLDLRASLRAFRLEIIDEEDRPIEQGMLVMSRQAEGEPGTQYTHFQNGKAVVFHSGRGLDVTITSDGFRDVALAAVTTDQKVVLRRGVEVRLVLAQGSVVPEPPLYLSASLDPVQSTGAEQVRHWYGEDVYFDARGVQQGMSPGVGQMRVQLMLTRRDENSWTSTSIGEETERIIEVAETAGVQTFEISFDPAKLEEAKAQLAEDG